MSYVISGDAGTGELVTFGQTQVRRAAPITTMDDVTGIRDDLAEHVGKPADRLVILNFVPLPGPEKG